MENITLGQIALWVTFLAGLVGGTTTLVSLVARNIKKYLTIVITQEIEPIKDSITEMQNEMAEIKAEIKKVDFESTKNFLIRELVSIEQGNPIDEIERVRFWEQYEHYTENGGNSYIKEKTAKLKAKGLL